MTDPRPDGPFEVPVERLARGPRDGRQAAIVAVAIVALVGGAFGLARWSAGNAAAPPAAAAPSAAPVAVGSAFPSARPRRSTEPRIERLLDIPDRAVEGAPHLRIVERSGVDLRVLEWTPGAGLAELRSLPEAITGSDDTIFPVLAPVGDRMVLGGPGGTAGDAARLIDGSGRTLWTGDDIAFASGAVWSRDGRLVAMAGVGRTWHLVAIDAAGTARDRIVDLPGEVFLPSPIPIGSITIPRLTPRTVPLGFSADGRWIYGGVVSPELGMFVGMFRVGVDGKRVERVPDLGVGRRDGLRPEPGTGGGRLVDPTSGRVANWRVNADTTGGPPTLEVRNPDSSLAFVVDVPTPLGSGWDQDGSLYVLSAESQLYADHAELTRFDRDGAPSQVILETGPITTATLLAVHDGCAVLVLWSTKPDVASQIVLVDLADPSRITALPIATDGPGSIIAAELRP